MSFWKTVLRCTVLLSPIFNNAFKKSFLYVSFFFLLKFNISKLYSDLINQSFHFNFYELLGKRLLSHNIFICVSNSEFDKGYHHHSNYMKPKYEVLIQSFESFLASPEHLCIETPGFPQKIQFCSVSALNITALHISAPLILVICVIILKIYFALPLQVKLRGNDSKLWF